MLFMIAFVSDGYFLFDVNSDMRSCIDSVHALQNVGLRGCILIILSKSRTSVSSNGIVSELV